MLLLATAAVAATLLAFGSGVASAATECPGAVVTVNGVGASLQKVAQERLWIPGYTTACTEVRVTYEPLGSWEGLRAWSAEAGVEGAAASSGEDFVATDWPPSAAQVANMRRAGNGSEVAIVPVAQTAISALAHPPTNCRITQIKNEELEQIFRHVITNWERVTTAREPLGGRCASSAITRVVRLDKAGTTFQFKHYLWLINSANVLSTGRSETERTWLQLQGAETTEDDLRWPEEETVARPSTNGETALVTKVAETAGSIGYASIANALGASGVTILKVLNGRATGEAFAEPTIGVGREANCEAVTYRRRLGTGFALTREEITLSLSWGEIFGSNPRIGQRAETATTYPICTLTWVAVYEDYERAGFEEEVASATMLYVNYLLNEGPSGLGERHYAGVPATIAAAVQAAFQAAGLAGRLTVVGAPIVLEPLRTEKTVDVENTGRIKLKIERVYLSGGNVEYFGYEIPGGMASCFRGKALRRGDECEINVNVIERNNGTTEVFVDVQGLRRSPFARGTLSGRA